MFPPVNTAQTTVRFSGKQPNTTTRRWLRLSRQNASKVHEEENTLSETPLKKKASPLRKTIGASLLGVTTLLGAINVFPVRPLPDCVSTSTEDIKNSVNASALSFVHSDPFEYSELPQQQRISAVLELLLPGTYQSPYDINQGLGVIKGIVFDVEQVHRNNNEALNELEALIETNTLSADQQRQLDIATQLNQIILLNAHRGDQQNDAVAFSEAVAVVIEANTTQTVEGTVVCQKQLVEDLKFFFINQNHGWIINQFSEFEASPTAAHLFGGPRVGTIGWKPSLRDRGQLTNDHGQPINQAHHLLAFLIEGLRKDGVLDVLPFAKAWVLDGGLYNQRNQPDIDLGYIGIRLGEQLRSGELTWHDLPQALLNDITLTN